MKKLNKITVNFKKTAKKAVIPSYAKPGDAGMDMTAISVNETENYIEYDTGIAMEIPEGYVGLLFPRSSISKYDLSLANSVGVVDSGYRNSIKFRFKKTNHNKFNYYLETIKNWFGISEVKLRNTETEVSNKIYKIGDKIGQIMIIPYPMVMLNQVDELSTTERGEGGFGSTSPEQCSKN